MPAGIINIPLGTTSSGPVWMGQSGANAEGVTLYNLATNTIPCFFGYTNAITVGGPNTIQLSPGDSVTLGPGKPVFAVGPVGAVLTIVPGSVTFNPGLNNAISQVTQSPVTGLTAGSTVTTPIFNFPVTAQSYLVELIPVMPTPSNYVIASDVFVNHFDAKGNLVGVEQFTVSSYPTGATFTAVSCLIRGKLLGTAVQFKFTVATSAWINTVTGASGLVSNTFTAQVYASAMEYPELSQIVTPYNSRILLPNQPVPGANSVALGTLSGYEGPAFWNFWLSGASTGTYQLKISSYQVTAGTTAQSTVFSPLVAPNNWTHNEFALDNFLHVCGASLRSGTVGGSDSLNVGIDALN